MVVYIEYVLLENSLLDGLLLYLALRCTRERTYASNLIAASLLGGVQAIVVPMIVLPAWATYVVKALGGVLLCLVALRKGSARAYMMVSALFFALTFSLGGMLTALYSFFDVETMDGTGFYIEKAPVALIIASAGFFAVLILRGTKRLYRHRHIQRQIYQCVLCSGERSCRLRAFADSGNCLTYLGNPVCVLSAVGIFALFGAQPQAVGKMSVQTVNGTCLRPVFMAERMNIEGNDLFGVYLTVGDVGKRYQMILHTALTEGKHERTCDAQTMARKNARMRKRRALPVRERGVASSALVGGRGDIARKTRTRRGGGEGQGDAH